MKKYFALTLLLFSVLLFGCSQKNNKERTNNRTEKIIRNQIKTEATGGLVIYQAFLIHQDGSLVGRNNSIKVGEDAELRLFLRGWVGPDGIISIGASQNFVSDKGIILWEDADIFANSGPITVDNAEVLRLKINVGIYQPEMKYYTSEIKVWNKTNPSQSATAKVKFTVVK